MKDDFNYGNLFSHNYINIMILKVFNDFGINRSNLHQGFSYRKGIFFSNF